MVFDAFFALARPIFLPGSRLAVRPSLIDMRRTALRSFFHTAPLKSASPIEISYLTRQNATASGATGLLPDSAAERDRALRHDGIHGVRHANLLIWCEAGSLSRMRVAAQARKRRLQLRCRAGTVGGTAGERILQEVRAEPGNRDRRRGHPVPPVPAWLP